ncbi:general secretion pathway protein GspL [Pollutimonas subterranea]|uniref:General secretion pathway protein GspL n=1 Tax=Pollutimonas subterranea TaxID=2045210 RepID=A0A2N4U9Z8_9BURK|nr:general secretion pathway protein GspL [Pollutimonas subterranea]
MRHHLRLALPLLSDLALDTTIAFVLIDRDGRVARAGQLPLAELGAEADSVAVHAILHPDDAVVADITVPPVSTQRLSAAVAGSIEPMALSEISQLCVAHGSRAADGTVTVAWVARHSLAKAWALLAEAGLNVVAFIPQSLALPANDPRPAEPLGLPADSRWLAPLPGWSLASEELRPASASGRWRRAIYWSTAATVVWVVGLNWYAARLANEVKTLQQNMQHAVVQAFPQIPVVIDPVRQAQNQRDALRLAQGVAGDDDFMSLAITTAKVLDFAQSHVRSLSYENDVLTLILAEGYLPPANEAALAQSAAVHQLVLQKDETRPHVWKVQRPALAEPQARRP